MNIVQITPGAGGMFCGGCFRDNALVGALRQLGHTTLMVPLYLPMTLDEEDQSQGTPTFFGGINVYLQQKSSLFRNTPEWLHKLLDSPRLLKWASGKAAKTRAEDTGDLTVSMLKGEEGNQARELDQLIEWLKGNGRPDVICLSNALLIGLARRLKKELNAPVVCLLSGEDTFLDSLPEAFRSEAWKTVQERAAEVDLLIAPSQYYAQLMRERLALGPEQIQVVPNGIALDGFGPAPVPPQPPVLGYFARMCQVKGLDTLVEAFLQLRQRNRIPGLKLRVGGGLGPSDEPFVEGLRERLRAQGLLADVEFFPNLSRAEKQDFFRSLSVFSVPALYGEAFGLYLLEAWAAGVPVVQPRHAAFPELIESTGGGLLCEPGDPESLAGAIERLLMDPAQAREIGAAGRKAVSDRFRIDHMARALLACYEPLARKNVALSR